MVETKPEKRWASAPAPVLPEAGDSEGLGALSETIRSFFFVLFRQGRKAAAFFLAVLLAAFLALLFSGRDYTSWAKLIVRPGADSVTADPTASTGVPLHAISKDWESEVNSELEILKSGELLESLVKDVGAEALISGGKRRGRDDAPDSPRRYIGAMETLRRSLSIEVFKKTDIIQIGYTAATPEMARDVVARLIDLYLAKHMAVRQALGAYEFFEEQTRLLEEQIDEAEVVLRNFKNVFGIASLSEQQTQVLDRIRTLKGGMEQAATDCAAIHARLGAIESMMVRPGEGAAPRPLLGSRDYQELRSTAVQEQTKLAAAVAQLSELKRQVADAERELQNLNDSRIHMSAMERNRDNLLAKHAKYMESMEQARINRALEKDRVSNIGIVQEASRPLQSNPRRRLLKLLLAAIVGLGGAVALAYVAEAMDHSLKRPEEVEQRLGLPILTSVPWVEGSRLAPFARGIQSTSWDAPEWAVEHLAMLNDRVNRVLTPSLVPPVVLGVTACREGEGVTGTASTLALTLVRRRPETRVLYVDANARTEPDRRAFGLRRAGAVELHVQADGRIVAAECRTDEPPPEAAAEAATTAPAVYDRWIPLIRKQDYGFVVFDMPPVSDERSAMQLGGSMDGVIVVVEAVRVRREIVQRALTLLREAKANLLGVVFNKRRFHVPDWLYQRL
jgi:uncharacterized protein involved in exopolysaccharide biosynthesis/Mrp family chromosome partitioning ATPase